MALALGPVEIPVAIGDGVVTIAGRARPHARRYAVTSEDETHQSPADAPQDAVRTEVLAALPVEVEVVVGRGTFSVGEIGAWRIGEVVTLPSRLGEPVLVRAGGRPVARGELCDVDGEVGVRLTELV
jgi:flagellar motor switch/type III secretory pathway protein FliN